MKTVNFLILSLLLLAGLSSQAQDRGKVRNELGITCFRLEKNSETLMGPWEPKLIAGLYYNRIFSNWSWVSAVDYSDNTIEDYCYSCRDNYEGIGQLTEFVVSSGIRYTLWERKRYRIKPFFETSLYYSNIRYALEYTRGTTGRNDFITSVGGLVQAVGISFRPAPQFNFSASSYFRMGQGNSKNLVWEKSHQGTSNAIAAVQIRIGYIFE